MSLSGGSFPASIVPSQARMALQSNFLEFNTGAGKDFAQQYLPELYEAEVERYGNRTLSGFLRMVGAEMPMTSDQIIWSEQNRLHIAYKGVDPANPISGAAGVFKVTPSLAAPNTTTSIAVRKGQTVLLSDQATGLVTAKVYVIQVFDAVDGGGNPVGNENSDALSFTCSPYGSDTLPAALLGTAGVNMFVYGSEFRKGDTGMDGSIEPSFTQFSNKPIIIKDKYEVSGSDASQIGWVEVTTEGGDSGYLWYLKGEGETRLRFEDYLEMAVIEGEKKSGNGDVPTGIEGTEGLFAAVSGRGQVDNAFAGVLTDFDNILKGLDKEGSIEENMLFLNRTTALAFDDMLGAINANYDGGTSFGVFNNSEQMALNLGFSGFRRGSYDFYKTDWKYLNDASTRGIAADASINGVLVPAGTSTVYDQSLGQNIRRPFLHVRYRASEADDRRMKSWLTGSVGGAATSSLDAMEVHFLSERCLCVQGANNFVLFTK